MIENKYGDIAKKKKNKQKWGDESNRGLMTLGAPAPAELR